MHIYISFDFFAYNGKPIFLLPEILKIVIKVGTAVVLDINCGRGILTIRGSLNT